MSQHTLVSKCHALVLCALERRMAMQSLHLDPNSFLLASCYPTDWVSPTAGPTHPILCVLRFSVSASRPWWSPRDLPTSSPSLIWHCVCSVRAKYDIFQFLEHIGSPNPTPNSCLHVTLTSALSTISSTATHILSLHLIPTHPLGHNINVLNRTLCTVCICWVLSDMHLHCPYFTINVISALTWFPLYHQMKASVSQGPGVFCSSLWLQQRTPETPGCRPAPCPTCRAPTNVGPRLSSHSPSPSGYLR